MGGGPAWIRGHLMRDRNTYVIVFIPIRPPGHILGSCSGQPERSARSRSIGLPFLNGQCCTNTEHVLLAAALLT